MCVEHTVRPHLRSHDGWVYWKGMVPGKIVLEGDLCWLALLGDDNAAKVSLRPLPPRFARE